MKVAFMTQQRIALLWATAFCFFVDRSALIYFLEHPVCEHFLIFQLHLSFICFPFLFKWN